jgi:hypothetical protein
MEGVKDFEVAGLAGAKIKNLADQASTAANTMRLPLELPHAWPTGVCNFAQTRCAT